MKLKLQEGELFAYNAGRKAERSMLKKIIDVEILALRKEMDTSVGGDASWQTFARIDALEDLKKRISCEQNEIKGVSEKAGEDSGNRAISDIPFPSRDLKNKLKEPEKEEVKKECVD